MEMLLPGLLRDISRKFLKLTTRHSSYFISTPIFYVNSSPHIGHVHTLLLADALNIYHRIKLNTNDTLFSTGTDEHGIKIQTAAELAKVDYATFCDSNAKRFCDLFNQYQTTVTDFVRTTDDRHKKAVVTVWQELYKNGHIYKENYNGWYSQSDECFVPEAQLNESVVDGQLIRLDPNGNRVSWSSEENYMFRLSAFEERIREWLVRDKPVVPEKFNTEAVRMLNLGVGDISISRPTSRLHWGIRVPDDSSQTIYVWLDALTNYLTVVGYPNQPSQLKRWPVDCQIIGKDILKFHAIYWPAFLLALGLELPKKLVCHSHWLVESHKMSKSKGNVVDPWNENQSLTEEGLRYYLLRAGTCHSDTDYSHTQAVRRVNAELADTYGNLMSRCCSSTINPSQVVPTDLMISDDTEGINELIDRLSQLKINCEVHFRNADFYKGIDEIMATLRFNNGLYESAKPWDLVKRIKTDDSCLLKYNNIQAITFECLRVCSIMLQPVVPKIAKVALDRLNVHQRQLDQAVVSISYSEKMNHRPLGTSQSVLFRRLR